MPALAVPLVQLQEKVLCGSVEYTVCCMCEHELTAHRGSNAKHAEHWARRKELKELIKPPLPPPEPGTKKKVKGSKAARAQAKRFKEV